LESPPTKILGGTRPLRPIGIDAPADKKYEILSDMLVMKAIA